MRKLAIIFGAAPLLCGLALLLAAGPVANARGSAADREPGQRTQFTTPSGNTVEILRVAPDDGQAAAWADVLPPDGPVTVFEEDFDSLPHAGEIPDGWLTYDGDGDVDTWVINRWGASYDGECCVSSPTGSPDTDNWLITSLVYVPTGGRQLQFYARHAISEQPFQIWVCETSQDPINFILDGEMIAEDTTGGWNYELHSYMIDGVPGHYRPLYLAIRHLSDTDFDAMLVDALTLPNSEAEYIDFEGPIEFPPADWSQTVETGLGYARWSLCDGSGTHPAGVTPHSGAYMAEFDSWNAFGPGESMRLHLPELDFSGYDNLYTLSFWMYRDDGFPDCDDNLEVHIWYDGDWLNLETLYRYSPTPHWEEHTYSLLYFAGDRVVDISFLTESWLGNGIYIDDVKITKEASEATCYMVGAEGIYADIIDNFPPDWGAYTYFNPEQKCGSPYPFNMTSVRLTLGDPGDCIWPVDLDVVIREPNDYWHPCDEPGAELARYSLVADEANFKYPERGYLELPEPFCITSPVFIGLEYTSGQIGAIPSFYFNTDYSPTPCVHWYYDRPLDVFWEWNTVSGGSLGAPMFTVVGTEKSGECQSEVFYYELGITPVPHPDSSVSWHQVWPEEDYCSSWHQDRIVGDTAGLLEGTDTISFSLLPDRVAKKQVQVLDVRHMVWFVDNNGGDTIYVRHRGPVSYRPYWQYPTLELGDYWSIDWPYQYHSTIVKFYDVADDGDGVLDSGDVVCFIEAAVNYCGPVLGVYTAVIGIEVTAQFTCGDADGNGIVNISDVVYLVSYIFGGGPPPDPLLAGDVDCNEIVNISDAVYSIAYIFGGGPEPCAACP